MLPHGSAKEKPLHEIPMTVKDYLQVGDALPKNPKTMEVDIRSSSTLEVCKIKTVGLGLVKLDEEGSALLAGSRTVVELLLTSNQEDGATSIGVGPGKKYEIEHKFTRNRRSKGMSLIIKIKEVTREGKLLESIGVGATSVAESGAVGIAMPAVALGSSRMLLMLIFWEA